MARNRIQLGDCIASMSKIENSTVDLVFADPPFNIGYDYDVYEDDKDAEDYLEWSQRWMAEVLRVLKPDGTFWLAIGDEFAAETKIIAQKELGLTCRSWVIWYYTFGVNCVRKFSRSHAHLFYFVKDAESFTFNDEAIRVPSARQLVYNDKRANPKGRLPDDTWILRPQDLETSFSSEEDTWYFPRVCGTFEEAAGWHGCQMPEQLLGRIIRSCSNPDDVVLDPFAGSGTTLAVAKKLGRNWVGFDVSEEYVAQVKKRLSRIKSGDALEGAPEPQVSAPATPNGAPASSSRATAAGAAVGGASAVADSAASTQTVLKKTPRRAKKTLRGPANRDNGLLQAFLESSNGYSVDRLLADPQLGQQFDARCRQRKLAGDPAAWRHRLIGLRKAGKLQAPQPKRTVVDRKELDPLEHGSEIAWQTVARRHQVSLDEILCCPDMTEQFDYVAGRIAPGWQPFQYRWAALTLRKKAMQGRRSAGQLPSELKNMQFDEELPLDAAEQLPSAEGLYVLTAGEVTFYLGWALNLGQRGFNESQSIGNLLDSLELHDVTSAEARVRALAFPESLTESEKLGLRAYYLGQFQPLANANLPKQAFVA